MEHRDLQITPEQFDEVAAELARSLDAFKVPERGMGEVLAAFAAHKGEVTEVPWPPRQGDRRRTGRDVAGGRRARTGGGRSSTAANFPGGSARPAETRSHDMSLRRALLWVLRGRPTTCKDHGRDEEDDRRDDDHQPNDA
jgi:hypothetical protein